MLPDGDPASGDSNAEDELFGDDDDGDGDDSEKQCSPESSLVIVDYAQSGIEEGAVLVWQQSGVTLDFKDTSKRTQVKARSKKEG